jgi:SAM-dependent methyltransferase
MTMHEAAHEATVTATTKRAPRTRRQKALDTITFPVRAVTTFQQDRWGLTCLRNERFHYVAEHVQGRTLDMGCGRHNLFIREFLGGNGVGVDVFQYEGLSEAILLEDPSRFPFAEGEFDSVTFIASLNHVPEPLRDPELSEAFRVLRPGGNVIVTMGHPVAEVAVHKLVHVYDRLFGTNLDMDSERGMEEEESYYLSDVEIAGRLGRAGFGEVTKRRFRTQWGLNHLVIGWKPLR